VAIESEIAKTLESEGRGRDRVIAGWMQPVTDRYSDDRKYLGKDDVDDLPILDRDPSLFKYSDIGDPG
jgi:hypothetical protein